MLVKLIYIFLLILNACLEVNLVGVQWRKKVIIVIACFILLS